MSARQHKNNLKGKSFHGLLCVALKYKFASFSHSRGSEGGTFLLERAARGASSHQREDGSGNSSVSSPHPQFISHANENFPLNCIS